MTVEDDGLRTAKVQVSLWCLVPRWALACDPFVTVNDQPLQRVTRSLVGFEVEPGAFRLVVVPFADVSPEPSADSRWRAFRVTEHEGVIAPGETQTFRFHPAYFTNSATFRGHIYRR